MIKIKRSHIKLISYITDKNFVSNLEFSTYCYTRVILEWKILQYESTIEKFIYYLVLINSQQSDIYF
jgi:hypothetical protein